MLLLSVSAEASEGQARHLARRLVLLTMMLVDLLLLQEVVALL